MTATPQGNIARDYPRTVTLENNLQVTLRLMTAADADAVVAFARALPPDDLLFLRLDITDPAVVATWVENIADGRTVTVLAESDGNISGYASIHFSEVSWQRHLGEIRLQVGSNVRSIGLGRRLANEVFTIARDSGLRKVMAQMTPDQIGAQATFRRLGFQEEARLQDFVIDRAGGTRDLVLMTHDLAGFTDLVDDSPAVQAIR